MKPSKSRASFFDSSPEFFKVFLPSFSSQHMSIPQAFVKYLNGKIPSKATLKDHSGKSWHVDLEELENCLAFSNGWKTFANDHFLKHGDFLIFQYDGNRLFDVKIFGKDGCKKEATSAVDRSFQYVMIKDEPEDEQTYAGTTHCRKREYSAVGCTVNSGGCKSRTISMTNLGRCGEHKTSVGISSEYPYFECTISKWSHCGIHIPKAVLDGNNIKLKPDVVLQDQTGKRWPLKIVSRDDGRTAFSTGWLNFHRCNNLKELGRRKD